MSHPSLRPRRWTVIVAGLLCGVLALVVLFTSRRAFASPLAVVVVAAIGFAAVLLQIRFRNPDPAHPVHGRLWLNLLGTILAFAALFSDLLHLSVEITQFTALAAVCVFGIAGALILHGFRRQRTIKE